jgi:hypothetical protein
MCRSQAPKLTFEKACGFCGKRRKGGLKGLLQKYGERMSHERENIWLKR